MPQYFRAEPIRMKIHPDYNEKWLQSIIAEDPKILGLGDLELLHKERRQPRAGRLDLLLRDSDTGRRYETEIQLGATDETHIIRTIEYWDIERKRYSTLDHCAVIIAEEITGRFLNVISLFNGHIPLIALQVQAISVNGYCSLVFTRVLDEISRGVDDDEDQVAAVPINRSSWEQKTPPEIMGLMDKVFLILSEIDPSLALNFLSPYVGLTKSGTSNNFVHFIPQKKALRINFTLPQIDEYRTLFENAGFEMLPYDNSFKYFRISLRPPDLVGKESALKELIAAAYKERFG